LRFVPGVIPFYLTSFHQREGEVVVGKMRAVPPSVVFTQALSQPAVSVFQVNDSQFVWNLLLKKSMGKSASMDVDVVVSEISSNAGLADVDSVQHEKGPRGGKKRPQRSRKMTEKAADEQDGMEFEKARNESAQMAARRRPKRAAAANRVGEELEDATLSKQIVEQVEQKRPKRAVKHVKNDNGFENDVKEASDDDEYLDQEKVRALQAGDDDEYVDEGDVRVDFARPRRVAKRMKDGNGEVEKIAREAHDELMAQEKVTHPRRVAKRVKNDNGEMENNARKAVAEGDNVKENAGVEEKAVAEEKVDEKKAVVEEKLGVVEKKEVVAEKPRVGQARPAARKSRSNPKKRPPKPVRTKEEAAKEKIEAKERKIARELRGLGVVAEAKKEDVVAAEAPEADRPSPQAVMGSRGRRQEAQPDPKRLKVAADDAEHAMVEEKPVEKPEVSGAGESVPAPEPVQTTLARGGRVARGSAASTVVGAKSARPTRTRASVKMSLMDEDSDHPFEAAPSPKKRAARTRLPPADSNWVESSDSPLISADLRQILTFDNFFNLIPPEEKDELLKLLPSVDRLSMDRVKNTFRFNQFFRTSVGEYQVVAKQECFVLPSHLIAF
jgi:hypothetical protein